MPTFSVISILFPFLTPVFFSASSTITFSPYFRAVNVDTDPAAPAPIIRISHLFMFHTLLEYLIKDNKIK